MRFLLVDDHPIFLNGLLQLLAVSGFDVVGTAHDGFEALTQTRLLKPDVVLMDVRMPRCDGLEGTRLVKAEFPDVRVVMLTACDDDDALFEAIRCGASGYLLKGQDSDDFLHALAELAHGDIPLAPGLALRILGEFARLVPPPSDGGKDGTELSPRQTEILALVATGMTYKQIGDKLGLSERTVKYYMSQTLALLHLKGRAEAVSYARSHNLAARS